jgi:SAM-dependent methyltransferase
MKLVDDWDWSKYTESDYIPQYTEVTQDHLFDLFISEDGIYYSDGEIKFKDKLHANHMEIYTAIYNLKPKSILECGTGGCYHLKNIWRILPEAEIYGCDISQAQLDFGKKISDLPRHIEDNLFLLDISRDVATRTFEFVFTQAVIMHLSTVRAMNALFNIRDMSEKYVMLMENGTCHEKWELMIEMVFVGWEMSHPSKYVKEAILLTKK